MKFAKSLVLVGMVSVICAIPVTSQTTLNVLKKVDPSPGFAIQHPASYVEIQTGVLLSAIANPNSNGYLIELPLAEFGNVILDVKPFIVFSSAHAISAITENGTVNVSNPESLLLRGSVAGKPGSHVMLAMYKGWCTGYVSIQTSHGMQRYLISPLPSNIEWNGSSSTPVIVYNEVFSSALEPWSCATEDAKELVRPRKKTTEQVQGTYRSVDVSFECDFDMYKDHGSDLTKTTEYAEAVIAAVSDIYQRDVSGIISVSTMQVWTVADPYTGTTSSTLLSQYRTYWRNNKNGVARDVSTLLSGVNNIGGVAYLDGMCSTSTGYSVCGLNNNITYPAAGYVWDTDVTAHELGHNIGSPHTHSCTWAPAIDSCYTAEGNCFTGTKNKQGTIMSYCHLTPLGKALSFHPTVIGLLDSKLSGSNCVAIITAISAYAGADTTVCFGSTIQLNGSAAGGSAPYTYSWTPTSGMTGSTTPTPTVTPAATTNYILVVRDRFNAVARDTVRVTVNPKLNLSVPAADSTCAGIARTTTVNASGGTPPYQYRWQQDTSVYVTTVPTLTFVPKVSGPIHVQITDAKGCSISDSSKLRVFDKPSVTLVNTDIYSCPGTLIFIDAVTTDGRAPFTFEWYKNGIKRSNTLYQLNDSPTVTSNYSVIVTDLNGCTDTASRMIVVKNAEATVTPSSIKMPALAVCDDGFSSTLTFTNTGTDTIVINAVSSSVVEVLTADLPLTLYPNQPKAFAMFIKPNATGNITDELVFSEPVCGTKYTVTISGTIGGFAVTGAIPSRFTDATVCAAPTARTTSVKVTNTTNVLVALQSVTSVKFGTKVSFGTSNLNIAGNSTANIPIVANVAATAGAVNDTLTINFITGGCQSKLVVPALFNTYQISATIPEAVSFDTVASNGSPNVIKDINVRADITGLQEVLVTKVTIDAPFSTSLKAGTMLKTNQDNLFTATFHPTQATKVGNITGTLKIEFDSCTTGYDVALLARIGVVSVDEENADDRVIRVLADGIEIVEGEGTVFVINLQGRSVLEVPVSGTTIIHLASVPQGVYLVQLRSKTGVISKTISIAR